MSAPTVDHGLRRRAHRRHVRVQGHPRHAGVKKRGREGREWEGRVSFEYNANHRENPRRYRCVPIETVLLRNANVQLRNI